MTVWCSSEFGPFIQKKPQCVAEDVRLLVHRFDKIGQYSPVKLTEQKTTWGSSIARSLLLTLLLSESQKVTLKEADAGNSLWLEKGRLCLPEGNTLLPLFVSIPPYVVKCAFQGFAFLHPHPNPSPFNTHECSPLPLNSLKSLHPLDDNIQFVQNY